MRPLLIALIVLAAAPSGAAAAVKRHTCADAPAGTRCGSIQVPLDRTGTVPGRLTIEFERYPSRGPRQGTMLAIEGGPGYSTTDSRTSYLPLLEPLRARRDLLLVDLRGTGLSGALDRKTFPGGSPTAPSARGCASPGAGA